MKILIANRGEIALRILRACKELGFNTVAVHSTVDEDAMHVKMADESVCIGPAKPQDSYLNKTAILSAALLTGVNAVHPGIGFLSENSDFANMVNAHGITFIGPSSDHVKIMGDKILAKKCAEENGIPTVPSYDVSSDIVNLDMSFPVIIKAVHGGGGRGMRIVNSREELLSAVNIARKESLVAFGSDQVYAERYLSQPMHIEVQIICDHYGNVAHLYERNCSAQRSNQKVIEECGESPIAQLQREKLFDICTRMMQNIGYRGVGTMEFLYQDGQFYFIEMNTRLQVEHTVTEMITDLDIVREQILIAFNNKLSFTQDQISSRGHAIECRINAECPITFSPSPGEIRDYHVPGGKGVRIDSMIYRGCKITPYYDSLISKLIVYDKDRQSAIKKAILALDEYVIDGVKTNIPLHKMILNNEDFINNNYTTKIIPGILINSQKSAA